ncbi:PalH-domain-containing protein [Sporormia fimetaria CBS 119925]|uniref:PalH-domain-containing protein n=1 Tax=Sporormia fimetaria CBS 119925 TaxID=1340428 RepID=A0A6A6V083_9PLEO|nr:PalH-domain-containing protein [Sporormia fimetaria CBS 119925]
MLQHCSPFKLPADGVLVLSPTETLTLAADSLFTPQCTSTGPNNEIEGDLPGGVASADLRDPFHASITPQAYATGAATVIAWMLVIMLIITPRTFFVGGASPRTGLMGRRGMISGASGGGSVIGVGTRPWLQKVAALTVAVSLTMATADTFKIAQHQYEEGFMDAMKLRSQVASSTEIRVSRVISDVFIWLAQVQTLIRLFPRHKEKVLIKWIGFALVLLDIVFSCLNNFGPYNPARPKSFDSAIPALSYLFQLSLSMLYAAWVVYYAITKRRYAFYHSMMWNITVVALLSIVAILTPIVFFITDIANHTIAGWGDYFRWVGAAAASTIVWEWVERIEALEREERKDGILGREVYDGDEMLETTPSHEGGSYTSDEKKRGDGGSGGHFGLFSTGSGLGFTDMVQRLDKVTSRVRRPPGDVRQRAIQIPAPPRARRKTESSQSPRDDDTHVFPAQMAPPVPVVTSPVSRADTASADSTVYAICYHPVNPSPVGIPVTAPVDPDSNQPPTRGDAQPIHQDADPEKGISAPAEEHDTNHKSSRYWQAAANLFRRQGRSPPPEVQRGCVIEPLGIEDVSVNIPPRHFTGLALKDRLGTFAAQQGERFRSKRNSGQLLDANLPVTIIPAQPRGRTWSPQEDLSQGQGNPQAEPGASPLPGDVEDVTHQHAATTTQGTPVAATEPLPSRNRGNSQVRFTSDVIDWSNPGSRVPTTSPSAGTLGRRVSGGIDGRIRGVEDRADQDNTQPTNHDR